MDFKNADLELKSRYLESELNSTDLTFYYPDPDTLDFLLSERIRIDPDSR